jgi:hypothetical protein
MIHAAHLLSAGLLVTVLGNCALPQKSDATVPLAHTKTEFQFTVNASLEQAAPLFGADKERVWAPGWDPQFVYPTPAHDRQGMVFQVSHGEHTSIWVNTAFDLAGGHIQYAYVMANAMVTSIDIRLMRDGASKTHVAVVYERTALLAEANDHVRHFAANDAKADKEWEEQINGYLAKQRGQTK